MILAILVPIDAPVLCTSAVTTAEDTVTDVVTGDRASDWLISNLST